MSSRNRGDTLYAVLENGKQSKLYYIDEFDMADDNGQIDTYFVCGGLGEDVVFIKKEDANFVEEETNQKILNVLVDISETAKYTGELLKKIYDNSHPAEDDDEEEEYGIKTFKNN